MTDGHPVSHRWWRSCPRTAEQLNRFAALYVLAALCNVFLAVGVANESRGVHLGFAGLALANLVAAAINWRRARHIDL